MRPPSACSAIPTTFAGMTHGVPSTKESMNQSFMPAGS